MLRSKVCDFKSASFVLWSILVDSISFVRACLQCKYSTAIKSTSWNYLFKYTLQNDQKYKYSSKKTICPIGRVHLRLLKKCN